MVNKPINTGDEPKTEEIFAALSGMAVVAAVVTSRRQGQGLKPRKSFKRGSAQLKSRPSERRHVSRAQSGTGGREGTAQDPCGLQAPDRREVRRGVLHHQPRWSSGRDLSGRGMAPDRREAGQAFELQSLE